MRLRAGLSRASLGALRRLLDRYASEMQTRADELCRRLGEVGVEASVAAIGHDESGELRGSIRLERRGQRDYLVVADCGYAVYVEFGTGVVGSEGPYPGERPEGVGRPGSRSRRAGADGAWAYFDRKQSRWRVTSGQRPQGFMARGAGAMLDEAGRLAREVFAS